MIETRRDELVDLIGDDRERQEYRAEQRQLELSEEELVRRGVDHLDLGVRTGGPLIGHDKDGVDLLGEGEADEKCDEDRDQRVDQARTQLDQMIHQRRLGGVDFCLAGPLILEHVGH